MAGESDPDRPDPAWPAPVVRDHLIGDVTFADGSRLPEVRLRCRTLGDPAHPAVLLLHGTCGSAADLLAPGFGGALFGPGQPLDARRHHLVLPDALGCGGSSKPSDGLRTRFPRYTYDDMVALQHRLVTEALGLRRLRLVLGHSMGGMHAWLWAVRHPGLADAVVPLACQPGPLAGRNWLTRRLLIDAIREDPAWTGGNYRQQPPAFARALLWFETCTSGGDAALRAAAPTRAAADALLAARRAAPPAGDANDTLYQFEAARDYDPSAELGRVAAPVLAINTADDERNPPGFGLVEAAMARLPRGEACLIPAGPETCGHATTLRRADLWAPRLARFLAALPPL